MIDIIGEFLLRVWLAMFGTCFVIGAALCIVENRLVAALIFTILAAVFFVVLSYR